MADERVTRRLAAIVLADVVGYGRLMGADELGTLLVLKQRRTEILTPVLRQFGGRIVKVMGDGVLMEFASAVEAVEAALELQARMADANTSLPNDRHILLRIGINLGDVIGDGMDLYGDGVNVAARLEALAEPGGICISGKVYAESNGKIPATFVDLGEVELKNIARPVRAYRVASVPGQPADRTEAIPAVRPSIVVLPFDNLSGDSAEKYFSDGITEEIITELSRFRNLTVMARYASFQLATRGGDVVQAAQSHGANYVVEGSVRRFGDRMRITAQFIDARTGNHIWAERYDGDVGDVFALQDKVVAAVVTTLEGRMIASAAVQARKRPTSSWTAYDFFLQGRELSDANMEGEAVPLFSKAVEIDPGFVQAHAWLAIALLGRYWSDGDPGTLREAAEAGRRGLELDNGDPTVQHANGMIALWERRHERAGAHFDRAVSLNPIDSQIRADRAYWLRFCGRLDEALSAIDGELAKGPYAPAWFWRVRGTILLDLGRYEEAVEAIERLPRKDHSAWLLLAAAYAHLGQQSHAAQALGKARGLKPGLSLRDLVGFLPFADPEGVNPLIEGLRLAGLPD